MLIHFDYYLCIKNNLPKKVHSFAWSTIKWKSSRNDNRKMKENERKNLEQIDCCSVFIINWIFESTLTCDLNKQYLHFTDFFSLFWLSIISSLWASSVPEVAASRFDIIRVVFELIPWTNEHAQLQTIDFTPAFLSWLHDAGRRHKQLLACLTVPPTGDVAFVLSFAVFLMSEARTSFIVYRTRGKWCYILFRRK